QAPIQIARPFLEIEQEKLQKVATSAWRGDRERFSRFPSMAEPLRVGLAGLGTVGASVVRLIERQREALVLRCGRPIEIVAVTARSRGKDRGLDLRKVRWVSD